MAPAKASSAAASNRPGFRDIKASRNNGHLLRIGAQRLPGPWTLGRWSKPLNAIALLWIAFCMVLFVLPPNQLAGYTFAGCCAALLAYWFLWMRRRFKGPPISGTHTESFQ